MRLRKFTIKDYEVLVDMFYNFTCEIYSNRAIGTKYAFYKLVDSWIEKKHDIVFAVNNSEDIVGFTVAYIDHNNGITEPVYLGDIAYVKPEYRKTRASYMLYKNVYEYSKELNMKIVSNSRIENGIDKMVQKHFNAIPKYIMMEGV